MLSSPLLSAFALGIVAGLRTMTAPAAVAWTTPGAPPLVRYGLLLAALGELVVDKLPSTPSRTRVGPFAGRIVSGLACGWVVGSAAGLAPLGALAGAAGAVLGTLGGHAARARLARAFGRDLPAALLEDVVAIGLATAAVVR